MDRLDVCTERIALVLGPDSVLAIARYVGKPAAAWTGDHAANFYRTSFGTNRTRARISRMAASNIRRTPQMVRGESDLLLRDQKAVRSGAGEMRSFYPLRRGQCSRVPEIRLG